MDAVPTVDSEAVPSAVADDALLMPVAPDDRADVPVDVAASDAALADVEPDLPDVPAMVTADVWLMTA